MIPFEKMIDGLFGKHSNSKSKKNAHTTESKWNEARSHFAIWWWWCENTNINTSSAEHNELPHLVETKCSREKQTIKIIVHNLIVKPCDFGYKSSSFFLHSSRWCCQIRAWYFCELCARERALRTIYTLRKSIDEQINSQQNETNWEKKMVTEPI